LNLAVKTHTDTTWKDNFFKIRCVSGGMKIVKTSKQESESGILDMLYSRDGSSFDEGAALNADLARPRPDRTRLYLAGQGCCLRGQNGFISQVNKRPHDDASFDLLDVQKSVNGRGRDFSPMNEISTVWFYDITDNILYPARDYDTIPAGNLIGLVVESLQQRHTTMAISQDIEVGMSLSFELVYHMEGIAD